jgi:hypothetical protein
MLTGLTKNISAEEVVDAKGAQIFKLYGRPAPAMLMGASPPVWPFLIVLPNYQKTFMKQGYN